jgi:hypothetical protein
MSELQTERPRLTRLEKAAQLRARAQRLESVERQQARKRDTRQKVVIGGAVIAEARGNPEFRAQLEQVIRSRVNRELDAEAVRSWLSTT